ncbi:MAG: hypothetical protein SF123_16975 [Chloroflexota bacterium]|nr:hypothetical protein [Chloroflexota bacterium]
MPLFVWFVFGAVIIGAGAMLSPAWSTAQPRIGLAAVFALALVIGGSLFIAALFGWSTLVIDYLLFALVTSIFLFGTLTLGQKRAEARGVDIADFHEGWTSARDLLFFALVALLFLAPVLVLPVPLGTDAQGFGYLGLMLRLGGNIDTLAPFQPSVDYLYAPGFITLIAYLSQQLNVGLHTVQFAVAAVLGVLLVWLAYDFGGELRDKRLGRAMAACMLIGTGLYSAYLDSHYTTLLALCFAFAFLTYVFRYLREQRLFDAIAAGLMLGAVIICHPDTTIILALGYAPWLLTMWLGKPRPTLRAWLMLLIGVPAIALLAIAPWLVSIRDLLGADIVSPFTRNPDYWRLMVLYQGGVVVIIAAIGAVIGVRERRQEVLLALGWLVFAFDFAITGITETLLGGLIAPLLRYDYPFSIAWHAPIIPFAILGGIGLLWLWDRFVAGRYGAALNRLAPIAGGIAVVLLVGAILFNQQLLALSKSTGIVGVYGTFSSAADVAAMQWLKANTAPDALILNQPGPHEADWAPVISERETIYFRPQPFFRDNGSGEVGTVDVFSPTQERLLAFWRDPVDPANAALLAEAGVDYVLVPQLVGSPASVETMFRWRPSFIDARPMLSCVCDAPYLRLEFDQDGAQVYAFAPEETTP